MQIKKKWGRRQGGGRRRREKTNNTHKQAFSKDQNMTKKDIRLEGNQRVPKAAQR